MDNAQIDAIAAWLIDRGLAGEVETELLNGFCSRCGAAGLFLSRAITIIDTLHPIYEGRAFRWRNDGIKEDAVIEYGRTNQGGTAAANWQSSVFYHLLTTGRDELHRRLGPNDPLDFAVLETLKQEGQTGLGQRGEAPTTGGADEAGKGEGQALGEVEGGIQAQLW